MSLTSFIHSIFSKVEIPETEVNCYLPEKDDSDVLPIAKEAKEIAKEAKEIAKEAKEVEGIIIEYVDAIGKGSIRRIIIKEVDPIYISAHCLERDAHRTFRRDRVLSVFDFDGIDLGEPRNFFTSLSGIDLWDKLYDLQQHDPLAYYKQVLKHEVAILRILALCDGRAVAQENKIILQYCFQRMLEMQEINPAKYQTKLINWIKRIYPHESAIDNALRTLNTLNQQSTKILLKTMSEIVKADGKNTSIEIETFEELGNLLLEAQNKAKGSTI